MIDPIKTVSSTPSSTADRRGSDNPAPPPAPPPPKPESSDQPLRLVVEPATGAALGYTYKLYDRATGALLIELPREQAQKMSQASDYTAGQVFSAKV